MSTRKEINADNWGKVVNNNKENVSKMLPYKTREKSVSRKK